ncbi:hypothetical protein EBT25_14770 [bacterium]|nr:hypothetical protein [bacterium]
MKKFTLTMSRTYQTIFEIEAENESEAISKLEQMEDRYEIELGQCNVINEQIECTEETAPPKFYAIISTWNGEGYSYLNTAEIRHFKNDEEAQKHLRTLYESNNDPQDFEVEETKGVLRYSNEEDAGSYILVRDPQKIFGVVIYTNINEVHFILNAKEWRNHVAEAIKQADPEEIEEINLSEKSFFIAGYNSDYDYQFIRF